MSADRVSQVVTAAIADLDALVALMRLQDGVEHVGDTRQPLLGVVCLLDESFLDALLGLVVGAADQSLK